MNSLKRVKIKTHSYQDKRVINSEMSHYEWQATQASNTRVQQDGSKKITTVDVLIPDTRKCEMCSLL